MTVRVRFAPSPSGDLHVGNARTALFNWLFARKMAGKFIFRVEDTDAARSTDASIQAIEDSMRWMGLDWDEGPGIGGPHQPYRQSQRLDTYKEWGQKLVDTGKAYRCFASDEELIQFRTDADARGIGNKGVKRPELTKVEEEAKIAAGEKFCLRFKVMEDEGNVSFQDQVRGNVSFELKELHDFNLLKSDGTPMYNFAAVVDDHLMGITHVLRGEDGISNTPRQLLIYQALGWIPPLFGHVSFIMGADHTKLSKSHGDTSISEFKAKGYLPAALLNYLGLLGLGGHAEGSEILSLDQLKEMFSFEHLVKNPAVFDYGKLDFLNAHYLRALPGHELLKFCKPYLEAAGIQEDPTWMQKALELFKLQIHSPAQLPKEMAIIFQEPDLSKPELQAIISQPGARKAVAGLGQAMAKAAFPETPDQSKALFKEAQALASVKGKDFFMPVRIAISGQEHGPELISLFPLLGAARVAARIKHFLDVTA